MIRGLIRFIAISLFVTGCAVQSTPDGGAKDETPPVIVSTFPENRSTSFTGNTIEIEFDEYVKVDGFTSQFISSPPLKYKVEHKLRKKTLTLTIADTLRENTTYTFSFGNAIKDITENNAQTEFKYVFSTGSILDSQIVAGQVIDAYSTLDQKGVMVALYEEHAEDSVFMKSPPLYYGLTDEHGVFSIENVAPGAYRLMAMKDLDFNYQWSGAAEALGYIDTLLHSQFNPSVTVPLFKAETPYKFYRGKYAEFGKIEMYFSKPAGELQIERLDTTTADYVIERPENGDTLIFWTNIWKSGGTGEWLITHVETGTVDTMSIRFTDKDTTKFRLDWGTKAPFSPTDSICFTAKTPITQFDPSKIHLIRDTVHVPFSVDYSGKRSLALTTQLEYGQLLKWVVDSGAVTDMFGRVNDSFAQGFKVLNDNELSIFHMTVRSDSTFPKVIEIFNKNEDILYRDTFTDDIEISLYDIHPQELKARVIYDVNDNGRWDTGDYFENRQPEKVIYLAKTVELRANWEIEEVWNIR